MWMMTELRLRLCVVKFDIFLAIEFDYVYVNIAIINSLIINSVFSNDRLSNIIHSFLLSSCQLQKMC